MTNYQTAQRMAWWYYRGFKPPRYFLLIQKCGQVLCCNPDHMIPPLDEDGRKICTKCGDRFDVVRVTQKKRRRCDPCLRAAASEWARNNPDTLKRYIKERRFDRFGITETEYMSLFESQSGACKICERSLLTDLTPHIDHDHSTGKVRGILCGNCNTGLGLFADSRRLLSAAIDYLDDTSASNNGLEAVKVPA